jgi:hypothetical protein
LLGLSVVVSAVRPGNPVLIHTHLLRVAAVVVVLTVAGSYLMDVTILVRSVCLHYCGALLEEMAIFIQVPEADPDDRSLLTLLRTRA